jgi:hypothetical protein
MSNRARYGSKMIAGDELQALRLVRTLVGGQGNIDGRRSLNELDADEPHDVLLCWWVITGVG